jgi:hypothetical protein
MIKYRKYFSLGSISPTEKHIPNKFERFVMELKADLRNKRVQWSNESQTSDEAVRKARAVRQVIHEIDLSIDRLLCLCNAASHECSDGIACGDNQNPGKCGIECECYREWYT